MKVRAAAVVAPLFVLAACSGNTDAPAAAGGPIAVEANDDACKVARNSADAGNITFEVSNKGSKVTEFYLYGEGDRIMGEVENIGPGLTRRLIVEVAEAGKFQTACKPGMKGDGIRGDFTVSGGVVKAADANAQLGEATRSYQRYVNSQTESFTVKTTEFVNAVKAGKVEEAKALYPVARIYWERIEPVAESFGDIDPKIDAREPDVEPGQQFTGFHRLEKDLWVSGLQADSPQIADQLLADVQDLRAKALNLEYTPVQMANGAKELLDEVARGKITGEEDQYSHTDLYDFRSNLDGSQAAVAALRPVIDSRDKALGAVLDDKFAAVGALLEKQRKGDTFKLYTELTPDEVKELAAAVDALGEPVSKVAEVVAAR
ncbi:EfeM/EfeO family lipoprotein [Kibdelosporangium philippinense]|uniref:EfeM/EfeO family lipoprotein n=1 Tax=Kibdelosporangium philippinense TaxID=211113 RepID=A0ABS8ZAB8_9PSEU|nr:iron uptake system protein EfeO [Kibdelosporangium philippinense]MCE7003626.1 EfeM/EfeO family lipoprotein [Kibdelosporangium philippinense]